MRDLLVFSLLRLGIFALLWWVLTLVGLHYLLAAAVAALVAMLISILFLGHARDRAAMRWKDADDRRHERRGERRDVDADAEDAFVDATEHDDVVEGSDTETTAGLGSERADDGADDTVHPADAAPDDEAVDAAPRSADSGQRDTVRPTSQA